MLKEQEVQYIKEICGEEVPPPKGGRIIARLLKRLAKNGWDLSYDVSSSDSDSGDESWSDYSAST